jgi:hypothetical protein
MATRRSHSASLILCSSATWLSAVLASGARPYSGLPHEAKIRACCAIMLDAPQTGDFIDDRFEKDMTVWLLKQLTAGDYNVAARRISRTPARTLDKVRLALKRGKQGL